MSDTEFIIIILASVGCFFIINWVILALGQTILATLNKHQLSNAYSSAYQKGSQTQVNDANVKLAYKKLEDLATTKKSYASRNNDIHFAMELGIPANGKLVKLLANALHNQNQQETSDLLSDYLQTVKAELKKAKDSKHNNNVANGSTTAVWLSTAGLTGLSGLLMEVILLAYLFQRVDQLKSRYIFLLSLYLIVVTAAALYKLNVGKSMQLSLSFLVVLFVLYGYSIRYHSNNAKPHADPGFSGNVVCPAWLRADDSCSTPIAVYSNSSTEVTLKIDQPDGVASFWENDKECTKPGASEFTVSSRKPFAFRLQAMDNDLFQKDNQIIKLNFQKVESNGDILPLDGLTCEIRVEEQLWANARQAILGFTGLTGVVTVLQIVVAFWKKPVAHAIGIDG